MTDSNNVSKELSLHPVHLTPDKEGNLSPSALVPFCSYQGNSSLLGKDLPELHNMTVCDKFQPTILEGQHCYTLDIAKLEQLPPSKSGKSNGLFLLLDPYPYQIDKRDDNARRTKTEDQKFKVYIHTLAKYTTFGQGTYAMSSLKKMTGTESFKELPDEQKECKIHNSEDCQTQEYLDQVQQKCRCIPWSLKTTQVIDYLWHIQPLGPQA